jgi:phosphonate transport system substrate-binding protein
MKNALTVAFFMLCCASVSWCAAPAPAASASPPAQAEPQSRAEENALALGIAPFASTTMLLKVHGPLRDHLARALGCRVLIYTSTSHEMFLDETINGRFDMVVTTAHLLPMMTEAGMVPLARYKTPFEMQLVVRQDSRINSPQDLRGHRVGLPDRLSLFYIAGMQWLTSIGLKAGLSYGMVEQKSHMAGLLSVDGDRIDALITTRPVLLQLEAGMRSRLRLVETGVPLLPTMTTLAHQDLGEERVEKIRAALLAFPDTPEGQQFFAATGYGGYVLSTQADIDAGRVYEPLVRALWRHRMSR